MGGRRTQGVHHGGEWVSPSLWPPGQQLGGEPAREPDPGGRGCGGQVWLVEYGRGEREGQQDDEQSQRDTLRTRVPDTGSAGATGGGGGSAIRHGRYRPHRTKTMQALMHRCMHVQMRERLRPMYQMAAPAVPNQVGAVSIAEGQSAAAGECPGSRESRALLLGDGRARWSGTSRRSEQLLGLQLAVVNDEMTAERCR